MLPELYYLMNLITARPIVDKAQQPGGVILKSRQTEPVVRPASAARRVSDFTNTLGVQIHMNYNAAWGRPQSPYNSNSTVSNALSYLNPAGIGTGVGTVRDTAFYSNAVAGLDYVAGLGYKLDLYLSYDAQHSDYSAQYSALSRYVSSGQVRIVEGGLEVDGFHLVDGDAYVGLDGVRYSGWQAAIAMQIDLWNQYHSKVPVALFSLADPSNGHVNAPATRAAAQLGTSLAAIAHYGNVHFYQANGNAPASPTGGQLSGVIASETAFRPGLPFVISEAGFNDMRAAGYAGTPVVNAKYTMNLFLSAFVAGAALTDYYELFDEHGGYGGSRAFQDHWGLFYSDGTPKPGAVALHNFLSVINDPDGAAFAPGSLDYQVAGLSPSNGRSLLFQKSDGSFIIVVWAESDIYTGAVPTSAPKQVVTVTLPGTHMIDVYDPMLNATELSGSQSFLTDPTDLGHMSTTFSNTVRLPVVDHPVLIHVSGGFGATPHR